VDRTASAEAAPRLACVDLPAWPLQLLLRRERGWRALPAAVVAEDQPQAPLLWVNEAARRRGILPGLRYAAALSLAHDLRAAAVPERELSEGVARLHRHLLRYSPRVEAAAHEPGVFWLDARGLERLHGPLASWAERLHGSLVRAGLTAAVAVGWTRFGSYGLARAGRGVILAADPGAKLATLRTIPLDRLQLDPRLCAQLARLGVRTLGALCDLPEAGLGARFGPDARALHRLARGVAYDPLQPVAPPQAAVACEVLEHPESDAWRLLFVIKRSLHPLLDGLADRLRAVAALQLELWLDDRAATRLHEVLRPAAPTLDAVLLLELVRLRLERLELAAGVGRVMLRLQDVAATAATVDLFRQQRRRDPEAAARALARVRAELGDAAVVRAELTMAHLPEARARWVVLPSELERARAAPAPGNDPPSPGGPRLADDPPPLVRRLLVRPPAIAPPRPDGVRGGPYRVSGGWWRCEVRRIYAFVRDGHGELRWVYCDLRRRRWRLQGRIE
jgi:protein ImuB